MIHDIYIYMCVCIICVYIYIYVRVCLRSTPSYCSYCSGHIHPRSRKTSSFSQGFSTSHARLTTCHGASSRREKKNCWRHVKPFKTIENHLKNTKDRKEFNLSRVTQLPLCVRPKRCLTTSTSLHTATRWFSITRWYLQRCNCRAVGSIFRCRTSISRLRVITIRWEYRCF